MRRGALIDAAVLGSADRGHIQAALVGFAGRPAGRWLPAGHPGTYGTLPGEWASVRRLAPSQVVEVVAVAAPNHCLDAWGFTSRTLAALMSGDAHAARHLAYYAQLRAALSMLANVGIGVFNRINFAVDSAGGIHRIDPVEQLGTHQAVWAALKEWASRPNTARIFLDMVRIRGTTLRECVELLWPGFAVSGLATRLVAAWGVDLLRGKVEHTFRNESSYNPQLLRPVPTDPRQMLDFIDGLWRHLEPSGGASLDAVDRHLLRLVLWEQHVSMTGRKNFASGNIYLRYEHLPSAVQAIASRDFLCGLTEPDLPELFERASHPTGGALEMTARAALLSRVATAFTYTNFVEAGVSVSTGALRPWVDELAAIRGFWPPGAPLDDPWTLYADIEVALDDLGSCLRSPPTCLYDWLVRDAKGLPALAEAERVGVWSLAS